MSTSGHASGGVDVANRILYVDLETGTFRTEAADHQAQRLLGGRGVDQWLLWERCPPLACVPDRAVPLIFGAGLLDGTLAPAASRVSVVSKNYATGGIGFSSAGGRFGPELRRAGFDHVVVEGRSPRPVYLVVNDGRAELRDARTLWGRTTWQAEDLIHAELSDRAVIGSIGRAGELLSKSACIVFERARAAAHCGLGAVMGSKNLKAVAVLGTGTVTVARPDTLLPLVDELWQRIDSSTVIDEHHSLGTLCYPTPMNDLCLLNVRNWQDDHWDPVRLERCLRPLLGEYERKKLSCAACRIRCSHFYETTGPDGVVTSGEGLQANAPIMFGAALGIDDPTFVLRAHVLCSQYGMDIDATAATMAWAFECYEKGLLTRQDTEGLELIWGDAGVADTLLRLIANREGIGDLLARGSLEASTLVGGGSSSLVAHMKGHEHFEALRAAKGWALGTAVATRGGGHLDGAPSTEFGDPWSADACRELFGSDRGTDPSSYDGKADVVVHFERLKAVTDCLGLCYFTTQWYDPALLSYDDFSRLLSVVVGVDCDADELMMIGERVHNTGKAFNTLHAGFDRSADVPVPRFFDEPIKTGPRAGERLDRAHWETMLDEYYDLHGWDRSTGLQTHESLSRLGLEDVAQRLAQHGRLAPCERPGPSRQARAYGG